MSSRDFTPIALSAAPTDSLDVPRRVSGSSPSSRADELSCASPTGFGKQRYPVPVGTPRYHTGHPVRIGDRVESIAHQAGTVVHVVGCARPMPGFSNTAWLDLKAGFLVREHDGVLMHYVKAPATLHLVARSIDPFDDEKRTDTADR